MIRFTEFGGPIHQRPVQDLAFAVARFIQKGGSFINYYMVGAFHYLAYSLSPETSHACSEGLCFGCLCSTMEEQILDALQEDHSLQQVMTMMLQ